MRIPEIERSVPLIDIEINRSGDGRTVTAYAATFESAVAPFASAITHFAPSWKRASEIRSPSEAPASGSSRS